MSSLDCLNVGCADASVITTDTATFLVACFSLHCPDWRKNARIDGTSNT
jgi:hypothetical protein